MTQAVRGADALVFAVRHEPCFALLSDDLMEMTGKPVAVTDCFGTLSDKEIQCYFVLWTRSERLARRCKAGKRRGKGEDDTDQKLKARQERNAKTIASNVFFRL